LHEPSLHALLFPLVKVRRAQVLVWLLPYQQVYTIVTIVMPHSKRRSATRSNALPCCINSKCLSLTFNFARGTDAVDPATKSGLPDETEYDITLDYRIEQGPLRGMWVRMRNAYVDFSNGGGSSNNVRLIINDPLALL
jgi:hypothetical protein